MRQGSSDTIIHVNDLSAPGAICLERIKHQIQSRFVETEDDKTFIPLYVDPRTAPFVDQLISGTLREDVEELFTEKLALIVAAKRIAFACSNDEAPDNDDEDETPRPDADEDIIRPVDEDDGICFDFVLPCQQGSGQLEDRASPGSASAQARQDKQRAKMIVQSWMEHCKNNIVWGDFLKRKDERPPASKSYKNLLHRLQYCDPMDWFRNVGRNQFPEVAILARVEFAKVDSSAIQERMFSAAAAAMTRYQTQMNPKVHEMRTILFANKKFILNIE